MSGKDQELAALMVLTFCCAISILGLATCSRAVRADVGPSTEDTQLVLARAAVAECGWRLSDCHAAVWHSFANRIERLRRRGNLAPEYTIRELAQNYCTALKSAPRTARHVWVQDLQEPASGAPPPSGWPEASRWDRHLPLWQRVYDRAGAFLGGALIDPCETPACHFGGDMDRRGPKNQGWRKTSCGMTCTESRCQTFYEC